MRERRGGKVEEMRGGEGEGGKGIRCHDFTHTHTYMVCVSILLHFQFKAEVFATDEESEAKLLLRNSCLRAVH